MEERYSQELIIKKEDFDKNECADALEGLSSNDYLAMFQLFSEIALKANDIGKVKRAKIYWLFSDTCSMMLSPENKSDPFKPLNILQGRRSPIVDDFSDEDIVFFSEIIEQVDNMLLKARLADILWLRVKKNRRNFAIIAIDSYRSIPLDSEIWKRNGRECWDRSFSLALMLRESSRVREMEKEIIRVFNLTKNDDNNNFALQLVTLLRSHRLGIDKAQLIASSLESHAILFDKKNKFTEAIDYFKASSDWYKVAKEEENSIKMIIHVAEMWVKKAIARGVSESNMVAASFYETAIQMYRTIPRKNRPKYGIDEKVLELHKELNKAGKNALDEMQEFSTKETNITELVNRARSAVSGKSIVDSIKNFANIFQGMQFENLLDNAIKQIKTRPLFSVLCNVIHRANDGRVVHKTPSLDLGADLTYDNDNVRSEVMRYHSIQVTLVVQAYIMTALEVLHLEHRIKRIDFLAIVQHSSIVPPGREFLFAKGLFEGYNNDFATALHILIPQIENMVRFHLKNADVKTTTLDANGIETENGLSTLVVLPEMEKIFGENLTFEIKALFCDHLGANLRNNLAHGLLDYNDCNSVYGIYAWWFVLRLIFNAFWNSQRVYSENHAKGSPNE